MKIFGLVGWSGSGKTTLVVQVLPLLIERGITVSTMKHTHHKFDLDRPGKDSHNHRLAGAAEVMLTSSTRWALLHELNDDPEPSPEEMLRHMTPVDLVLIEGFKTYPHPKIEVHRPSLGKPLLAASDVSVVAVATDESMDGRLGERIVPVLDLNNVRGVADFIVSHVGLDPEIRNGAA